jgi:hypothetical protein
LRLKGKWFSCSLVIVHAPTNEKMEVVKEEFYIWCMCVHASCMKMMRGPTWCNNLFIIINNYMFRASICPSSGVLGCIRCMLLHMVFSTRCCGWGPEEPVCSLVHCV